MSVISDMLDRLVEVFWSDVMNIFKPSVTIVKLKFHWATFGGKHPMDAIKYTI
jgi:hypothetical protein